MGSSQRAINIEKEVEMNNDFIEDFGKHLNSFSIDNIIQDLPKILRDSCNVLVEENEKEVFLIGALGVVSGLLPNIKGLYDGKWISPNLYVYVLSGYGGGKGSLNYARALGEKIHQDKKEETKRQVAEYQKNINVYKKALMAYNKDKKADVEPPVKPTPPPSLMLFIPSNNSKSGVYQLLQENNERGIIFESEGDTLVGALNQDYGNFSDTLRKAFHHEHLDFFRRMNNENVSIQHPELSVVLSSTFDQLKNLIKSTENGLYSRFLYYELKQNNSFNNVFDNRKEDYRGHFNNVGEEFKHLYNMLEKLDTPIWFNLSDEQKGRFVKLFNEKKGKLIEEIDSTMSGTANRLGIIAYRIMMILTALRNYDNGMLNNSIKCTDVDFHNAFKIIDRLEKHAKTVYEYLTPQPDKKNLVMQLRKSGVSIPKISETLGINKGTISKWCKN